MIFDFEKFVLDIDVERTRELYRHAQRLTEGCECQGCRNYVAWAGELSTEPKPILESMGVHLEKISEAYVNCQLVDGTLYYEGWYHLCGRILQGPDPWIRVNETCRYLDREAFVSLGEHYRVTFMEESCLLENDFPTPVIQMEIQGKLPFLLLEGCDYPKCDHEW